LPLGLDLCHPLQNLYDIYFGDGLSTVLAKREMAGGSGAVIEAAVQAVDTQPGLAFSLPAERLPLFAELPCRVFRVSLAFQNSHLERYRGCALHSGSCLGSM
jgi:hypothetical protein